MPDYLRVKQRDTGHELSVTQAMYDFAPDSYDVLDDKPATNSGGAPLPAKYKTTVAKAAERKTTANRPANSATQDAADIADDSGQQADTEKENGR